MSGLFILSLDTEIAWGTVGAAALKRSAGCFDNYRLLLRWLVALLDTYAIPATWAVVGHLFLKPGDPRAIPHKDPTDWYYGADVIEAIRGARMPHEIGTHTFSHVFTSEVTRAAWEGELALCATIYREHGLPLKSLVFPRNQIAYTDSLPRYGVMAYRGVEQSWYRSFPRPGARAAHWLDRALGLPPPTYDLATLKVGEVLVNLPASQFLMHYDGPRRWIPTASRVRQARLGLDAAVRGGQLYHLWFHPFNLGSSPAMFDALEQILRDVARRREVGQLRVLTMADAAEWVLGGVHG
jgi:peptidoglycan/xylan/chitin deacetylase (PgdA/CDA1 family)